MTRNNNKYKWCRSFNNGNIVWGFHWKDGHDEWKNNKDNKPYVRFYNPATNEIIYCSYLMTTSEYPTEQEENYGDDSQDNDLILLSFF